MSFASHIVTVRRLKKYIDDVIGKKVNLPDTSKTIIGNISQLNSELTVTTKTITKGAIFTLQASRTRLLREGNKMTLLFQATYQQEKTAGKVNTLATFASDLSPSQNVYTSAVLSNGDVALVYVDSSGNALVNNYKNVPANTVVFGEISWFIGK